MNDDFLTRFRKPPRREFSVALYERISKPMYAQPEYLALRRTVLVLSVFVAVVLAILFISPPARTFAANVLRQIGVFTIVDDSNRTSIASTPAPTALPPSNITVQKARDAAEASELAGFTVYAPAYLPDGYDLEGWSVMAQGNGMVVVSIYRNAADSFLNINQYMYGEGDHWEIEHSYQEDVTDVTVRGQAGVWITGIMFKDSENNPRPTAWLMWDENGVNYSIFGDALSLDNMLKIAESLTD